MYVKKNSVIKEEEEVRGVKSRFHPDRPFDFTKSYQVQMKEHAKEIEYRRRALSYGLRP